MGEALKEARRAEEAGEVPVGAVVVCRNRIIARAHNFVERLCDATAHAEMQAITAASSWMGGKYLHECALYVTLEPCAMCAGALRWAQIGRLIFGAADPKNGYRKLQRVILHPSTKVNTGILSVECAVLMKKFFEKKREE